MKQRIKAWLIHQLGGITRTEACNVKRDNLSTGTYVTLVSLRRFADKMNGKPADEWCKRMYDHISDQIWRMERTTEV
jgi:hypothetical protein|nr:MAG TPA: hypothetical protein [Caudoviricetes sp.]